MEDLNLGFSLKDEMHKLPPQLSWKDICEDSLINHFFCTDFQINLKNSWAFFRVLYK